jgi:hypothetical protein
LRSEFAQKIKSHDWYYGYSDDHSVWRRGQAAKRVLLDMHKKLTCPFSMKMLMHWAHSMILEEFTEEKPGQWYRQPRKYKSTAPASREDLITREEHEKITHWMTLGSDSTVIATILR